MPETSKDTALETRRGAMKTLGSLGLLSLFGCGGSSGDSTTSAAAASSSTSTDSSTSTGTTTGGTTTGGTTSVDSCTLIPAETEGPYPLLAILSNSAIVRKDIKEGKTGIPLTLTLNLQNINQGCAPISNAAIYIWHCDKDGQYSGYSSGANGNHQGETFLRGVQVTDANGQVTFDTIFPGWYAGRITHIHFQVYLNDNLAVTATATSQLAFLQEVTQAVYNTPLYASRGQNTSVTSFSADNVFSDGVTYQIASVTGDPASALAATLNIGIAG